MTLSKYRRVKSGLTVLSVCFPFSAIVTAVFAIAHFCCISKNAGHHDSRTSRVKVWYALHHMFHASVIPVFCCSTEVQFLSVLKISVLHPYFVTKISRPYHVKKPDKIGLFQGYIFLHILYGGDEGLRC